MYVSMYNIWLNFFFKAEDGIRYGHVTGVQTCALPIFAILVGGYDLFITGIKNLFRFYFDLHTLMTIAIIGAAFIGEWVEGAAVVILFAISEALEAYSVDKARQSIKTLVDIAPNHAIIRRGNNIMELHVNDIQIDDLMMIKPGEKIAMDGEVISGRTSINQAAIKIGRAS